MVGSSTSEPVRRRTFFSSSITIQPDSNASTASATRASSSEVLSAFSSPPRDSGTTRKKSRATTSKVQAKGNDSDAISEIFCIVDSTTGKQGNSSRNASSNMAQKSSNGPSGAKASEIGIDAVDLGSSRARRSAVPATSAVENGTNAGPSVSVDAIPRATRQYWSTTGSSAKDQASTSGPSGLPAVEVSSSTTIDKSQRIPVTPPRSLHDTLRMTGKITKRFMEAGFYCQDDFAKSPHKLVSKILMRREAEAKLKSKLSKANEFYRPELNRPAFPPLPYDYGYELFFGEQHDFVLPFNIRCESENGLLDGKKKPAPYSKLRANVYPERGRVMATVHAVCRCDPESGCGDNCINRIMSYLCGRDCPCGETCTNKSLVKRKTPSVKLTYTGSRGFGLFAQQDINEGEFVIDYRGEIICLDTYQDRCQVEYAASRNFYALAYDQDEVIDAGGRGNEARFINHSCNPNLAVHRLQALGDGLEEYEVGMWASRDIVAGEELTYDYNFDAFGVAEGAKRVECRCGAVNCVGYLGRKIGEKSARQIALDMEAEANARAKVQEIRSKRPKSAVNEGQGSTQLPKPVNSRSASKEDPPPKAKISKSATSTRLQPILPAPPKNKDGEPIAGPSHTKPTKPKGKNREPIAGPSKSKLAKSKGKETEPVAGPSKPRRMKHRIEQPAFTGIMIGGRPVAAKIAECMTSTSRIYQRKRKSESQITDGTESNSIAIPPPVDFYRSSDKTKAKASNTNATASTSKINKGKQPEIRPKPRPKPALSIPNLSASTTWKIMPETRKIVPRQRTASDDVNSAMDSSSLTSVSPSPDDREPSLEREPSPVPLFVPRKGRRKKEPEDSGAAASASGTGEKPAGSNLRTEQGSQGVEYDGLVGNDEPKAWIEANQRELEEKPRTLEEWNFLRAIRRRRPYWIDRMVKQYGSLPSKGHPGNVGSMVSEQLLADKRKEALDAGIDITESKKRKVEAGAEADTDHDNDQSRRKSEPNRKITIKFTRKTEPAQGSSSTNPNLAVTTRTIKDDWELGSSGSEEDQPRSHRPRSSGTPAREAAIRAKREAIEKRNGAPKGWAYEVVPVVVAPPPAPAEEEPEDLTRGSRRRHTINYNEGRRL